MTFKKYNHTNNAFCELLTDLQSSDNTMILTGNYNRLPTSNFIVKISKYQGTKCVARENIYVANRNNNICTELVRAYEKVPMDDDATEWIQQALNFSTGDIVECVISSKIIQDIQENFWNLNNIPDKRNEPLKAPKEFAQIYTWYEFRPINSDQTGSLNIPWEGKGWAVVQTIGAWSDIANANYHRQIAYRVHPKMNEIYMRFARDGNNWGNWEKIFPLNGMYDGRYSETGIVSETIKGTLENPVPVCVGKLMRVDVRKQHINKAFRTNTNSASTNRQIVIKNGEYQMKLKKLETDTDLSNSIYIEVDGSHHKHHLGNLNKNGTTIVNFTLEPNTTYVITGFPTEDGWEAKEYIQNKNITIADGVGGINALEFDLQGKIYPCQANSMYTCLARCDGLVTKTEQAWSRIRIGYIDNYFYADAFSSIAQNWPVYIWNWKGVVSSTPGEIPAIIGIKKPNGFVAVRQHSWGIIFRYKGYTRYNDQSFENEGIKKESWFFAGGQALFYLKWGWRSLNADLHFVGVDGFRKKWNVTHWDRDSGFGPLQFTETLEAWYFYLVIKREESHSYSFEMKVTW